MLDDDDDLYDAKLMVLLDELCPNSHACVGHLGVYMICLQTCKYV